MNKKIGIWIDHRKAVIATVSDETEETLAILSGVDKQPGRSEGVRATHPYEAQKVPADDRREHAYANHLNQYYDKVISLIREANAILILGPGEAKNELKKRLERIKLGEAVVVTETADKMTDRQVVAKVRAYFQP